MGGFVIFDKNIHLTFLCAVLCFGWTIQDKVHVHVPTTVAQTVRQQSEVCSKETGVPAGMMKQMITVGPIPDDEATKKYLYCVCYNAGYTDVDGHLIIEEMKKLQVMNGTTEDYVKTLEDCNKISMENPIDTVHAMGLCIHKDFVYTI